MSEDALEQLVRKFTDPHRPIDYVDYCILDGTKVIPCNRDQWLRWYETNPNRHVADTTFAGIRISTVFLGLNPAVWNSGAIHVFETMVFAPTGDELDCTRCGTWEDAVAMHERAIRKLPEYAAEMRPPHPDD